MEFAPFSSFTAECFAIIEALTLISSFLLNKFLISSNSMSLLLFLSCNLFNSHVLLYRICIKSILLGLSQSGFPVMCGIQGNEVANSLSKSSKLILSNSLAQSYDATRLLSGPPIGRICLQILPLNLNLLSIKY